SVKTVSRSSGRSATAAAAYRSGEKIVDERTGEVHDYTRKKGVESCTLFLPDDVEMIGRADLWNAAEIAESRKNSTVAREFEVALPDELDAMQREQLAHTFTQELVKRFGFAADCAIHKPSADGDEKNHHAHILCSTRKLTQSGFGQKTRELDDRETGSAHVFAVRELWATLANDALEKAGHEVKIDHRSHADRGLEEAPSQHRGPKVTEILLAGDYSNVAQRQADEAARITSDLLSRQMLDEQAAAAQLRKQSGQAMAQLLHDSEVNPDQPAFLDIGIGAQPKEQAGKRDQAAVDQAAKIMARLKVVQSEKAQLELAKKAHDQASRRLDELRSAAEFAMAGQKRAGSSLWETIKSLPKTGAWQRAIDAFEQAQGVLEKAGKAVLQARDRVAGALRKLAEVDGSLQASQQAHAAELKRLHEEQQARLQEATRAAQESAKVRARPVTTDEQLEQLRLNQRPRPRHRDDEIDAPGR
ncbi:MAG: hypothetical protein COY49_03390, partial [Comamonadaceae bacterium CG_4_10_14_0_8_um_filter_57_29]